jgi:ferredoxin
MSTYQQLLLYTFSGTGNALLASRWIADNAKATGLVAQPFNIEHIERATVQRLEGRTLIGFCYPTHGFIAPWLVLKFFWRFPRIANADVFFLNTRAGFGLYFIHNGPGLSGLAQWFPIVLFALRRFRVVGSLPLDMPHSWISCFWPNTRNQIEHITARCQRIVDGFCERVLTGRRYFRFSVWLTLPLDLAVAPISVLYLFGGRFLLAKTLFASLRCDQCQLCIENCPVNAIQLRSGRPFWKATCESCMRCINICPKRAIQSWVTRMAALSYGLLLLGISIRPLRPSIWFCILSVLMIPIYRIMHQLWRIRVINHAFTYSSLTRVWHRYLARGIRVKDLRQN